MPVSASNTVVAYRSGDTQSEEVTDLYVARHNLPAAHKVALPCSSNEILNNEAAFDAQVRLPLKAAVDALEVGGANIMVIVLSFRVPGGFRSGNDVISSTSRISRIHKPFVKQIRNDLFDRRVFSRFETADKGVALIASRIDAPTIQLAKDMVENADRLRKRAFVNGKFYLDPYSDRHAPGSDDYTNELLDFQTRTLPVLNLEEFSTVFLDPYVDVVIPFAENDSFIWSWFTDRTSLSFFKDTGSFRVFLYNADFDGAATVRGLTDGRWTSTGIQAGYLSTAGAMSAPTIDGFLRPQPFFETLIRGGTLGEAYLFSQPFFDWTISFLGDPLVSMSFPAELTIDAEGTNEIESIRLMSQSLSRALAYGLRKETELEQVRDRIVLSLDIATEVDLLLPASNLYQENTNEAINGQYSDLVVTFADYIENRNRFANLTEIQPNVSTILSNNELQFSELIQDAEPDVNRYSSNVILNQGSWQLEFVVQDDAGSFAFYHFGIEVSESVDFDTIDLAVNSQDNQNGWFFEANENEFSPITVGGVRSSFVGKRVRYESQSGQNLSRSGIYNFRVRQIDQLTTYDFREFADIIFT